jgi:hypothetical protein
MNNLNSEDLMRNVLFALLFALLLSVCSILAYTAILLLRNTRGVKGGLTRVVLLSEDNTMLDSFSLAGRTSALISEDGAVDVGLFRNLPADGYAVINRVGGDWFIERLSDEYGISIKRADENLVYKLKINLNYKLGAYDILYVGADRFLII